MVTQVDEMESCVTFCKVTLSNERLLSVVKVTRRVRSAEWALEMISVLRLMCCQYPILVD